MNLMIEIICGCVCALVCCVNCFCSFLRARKTGKQIERLCEKCGVPVVENEQHSCALNSEQLTALELFVASMRGN